MAQSTLGVVEITTMLEGSFSSPPIEGAPRGHNKEIDVDPRCRIVVVSSSMEAAKGFVERVISLSDGKPTTSGTSNRAAIEGEGDRETSHSTLGGKEHEEQDAVVIPHTLRNRYYEADVWFWVVGVEKLKNELTALSGSVREEEEEIEDDGGFGKFDAGDGAFDSGSESEDGDDSENGTGKGTKMTKAPAIVYVWDDVLGMERCRKEIEELVKGMKRSGWHGDEGAEVCLAVRTGGGGEEEEGDGDLDGMFMGHGFEYVDGRDGKGASEVDEDVPRLPRVVDALSTVMWASMRSKSKAAGGYAQSKEEEEEERQGIMSELLDVVVNRSEEDEEEEFGDMVSSPVDMDMLSPFGFGEPGLKRKVSLGFEDDFVEYGGYVALSEEEEEGMPSHAEIEETASRIFGGMDLNSVFATLQELKGEIGAMEDSEEKKRMAARVALGLAYGLDIQ